MNNRARRERHARRWARYFNHYAGVVPDVAIGGHSAARLVMTGMWGARYARPFLFVRRQGKR